MSVKNIENINIPGFGQYSLYSFRYTPGFSTSAGSIEAEFINKSGEYSGISLEGNTYFEISISGEVYQNLGDFLVASFEVSNTNEHKILKVKFVDRSIELDRRIVALRGDIGYDKKAHLELDKEERALIEDVFPSSEKIIWVGERDEFCDEKVLEDEDNQDPCDPCDKIDGLPVNVIDCKKHYLQKKRVYTYLLSDLIKELNAYGNGLKFSSAEFKDYKFQYTGTVREVLNNICSEIGFTFYYDPYTSTIVFVDIRLGIIIDAGMLEDEYGRKKILEQSIKKSRESSKDVVGVPSFQREGEEKSYSCDTANCKKLKLQPLVIEDLLTKNAHFDNDEVISDPNYERLEFYCVLSGRVGRDFRDMFLWYQEYKFNTAKAVEGKKDKLLAALNGMKIKRVFHSASTASEDSDMYRTLFSIYAGTDYVRIKERATNKCYFFLAEVDEKQDEILHNLETSICNSFIGQYWLREYKKHWTGISYNTISPDNDSSSINYYDFKNPINLPFADIIVNAGGILKDSEIFQRTEKESFYFLSRPAIFSPLKIDDKISKNIEINTEKYLFKEIDVSVEIENKYKQFSGISSDKNIKYKLFVVPFELGEGSIGVSTALVQHPEEIENVNIPVNACGKSTSYGLQSAESKKFNVSFNEARFDITMPPQSYSGVSPDGYTVLIERSDSKSTILPKSEIFVIPDELPTNKSWRLGIELSSYRVDTNDLKYLNRNSEDPFCSLDKKEIKVLLNKLKALMNYSTKETEERTYKIEGLPLDKYNVANGLKSINIGIGASGLTSEISFSNSFPFKLSPEQYLKKLRYSRLFELRSQAPIGKPLPNLTSDLFSV